MTDTKDSSSLPLLFVITGTIVAVAVGGWFFLEQGAEPVTTSPQTAAVVSEATFAPASIDDSELPPTVEPVGAVPEAAPAVEVVDAPATGVEAELRKARLAAEADILVVPAEQSALHYYGRILDADPGHEVANAELDAMLARVAQSNASLIAAEEYEQAYNIAALVAPLRPNHALVIETQQALDDYTESLVQRAIQLVRNGDDNGAQVALARAEGLPARNPDYFAAVRASMAEIRDAREAAAERDRRQRAIADARDAWVQNVRGAIARGELVLPAGGSARDLLSEPNNWTAERAELTAELTAALADKARNRIEGELLDDARLLIDAAAELGADAAEVDALNAAHEDAVVALKSKTPVPLSQLTQVKTAAPEYPRRAFRYNTTGYVDLIFTVMPDGTTTDIEVFRAEPETVFDDAAIKAVSQWEFEPVEYRGRIISQKSAARLVFRLE